MKIVLSRKGFDSANGKVPSPILPDGTMCSLPIPAKTDAFRLSQLRHGSLDVAALVSNLTRGRLGADQPVHLDPDIHPTIVPREQNWVAALGQSGSAQSHLAKQGVTVGDVFLFYGWYRAVTHDADSFSYVPGGADLHALFGWLQIGSIWNINRDREALLAAHPGAASHPHLAMLPKYLAKSNNTLYVAARELRVAGLDGFKLPGAGVFDRFSQSRVLTSRGMSRRHWRLPSWFHNNGKPSMSYHSDPTLWTPDADSVIVRSAAIGQEFVMELPDDEAPKQWLRAIFGAVS